MHVREFIKIVAAVLVCAAILSASVLWNEMPGSFVDCSGDETDSLNPDGSVKPYEIVHCFRIVPMIERIGKVVVSLFAFVALAYVTNRSVPRAKVWASTVLSAASAVIASAVLGYLYGRVFEQWLFPDPVTLLGICSVTGVIGGAASWALARWWPNNSLERTREG